MGLSTAADPHAASVIEGEGWIELVNERWAIRVATDPWLNPSSVRDRVRDRPLADESYAYDLVLEPLEARGFLPGPSNTTGTVTPPTTAEPLRARGVRLRNWTSSPLPAGGVEVRFVGQLDFGLLGPTDITLEHVFRLPEQGNWFEEQIRLVHRFGRDTHHVRWIRFAFRKTLYDRDRQVWLDDVDQWRLVPVPHRRRWGQIVDHLASDYSANDLVPANWSGAQLPGRGAEAWVWTDGDRGYLVAKYNRQQIEFALAEGEFILAPSKRSDAYYQTFNPRVAGGANLCLRFGGVGRYQASPESARVIGPESGIDFGVTRVYPVEGDWAAGYAVYKDFLKQKGHTIPSDFDPPVHWNELYNLGWRGGDNAALQEPPEIMAEAALAKDIGAEALYFDPVWDVFEGSSVWDEARLGPLDAFVTAMRDRFGLKTSLHLMMHTKSFGEDARIYRRRQDGSIDVWPGLYSGGRICAASSVWQRQKIDRLLRLAAAGVTFFMFDFLSYVPPSADLRSHRDPDSACWDPEHGHQVPMSMQEHAEGILTVIQAVKERYPDVLIESHDRISGGLQDFHPLYFQHGLPNSFDENWGFEYMWDPYMDLLSGKALSLYEYNLAYDIPLYLHIHCGQDNQHMLAFWWYASMCRHLGIGGVKDPASPLYQSLKRAMADYLRLKAFFARGRFVGLDLFVHAHVLDDRGAAVIVLFNLSGQELLRSVDVPLTTLGISAIQSARGAEVRVENGRVRFEKSVAPLSPCLVELNVGA
ncbi:MAG: hypothetical protein ACR2IK_17120 [Chloroflexota bacterium]